MSGQEASFLGVLSRDPSLMCNTVNYVSPWTVEFQLMRSFLRSLRPRHYCILFYNKKKSWLVFQYPVVAALFPDVIEHKMFWKTFRLLIFEDGSRPWGRLRRNLPKVQTFAGPCCSSFLMFRVVDFFFLFPWRRLPTWWLHFALILVIYWASFQICFGVEMLAGLLGFIPLNYTAHSYCA